MKDINKQSENIRLVATAITIAEYGLIGIRAEHELKQRVNRAIQHCRAVQKFFTNHPDASDEVKKVFDEQFRSDEIVLLTELVKTCFGIDADGLETIIKAIKGVNNEPSY